MRRINRTCYASGCVRKATHGAVCNMHYEQHIKGKEDFTSLWVMAEIDDSNIPIGKEAFKKNLQSILRGVKATKKQRRDFNDTMMRRYEEALPNSGGSERK
jgi:hypothetical protein